MSRVELIRNKNPTFFVSVGIGFNRLLKEA